ncbi:transcriptional regulator [Chryseobacterium shigense]|uniref:Transcriptional regulator n=4 Tax=Chryseobacterium TaxID=59732 RepID=A0A1N7I627_9FLAO|nr:transcriptional regulator [Chryseobacterium shigense]
MIYSRKTNILCYVYVTRVKKFLSLAFRIYRMKINLADKLYYSIGEVAKAFDVNTSLIRYWEQEFPIIKPKKNKKGNRYFTPEDIKNLQMIYHLVKEKGYTLDGARIALTTNSKISETVTIIDRLEFIKAELQKLKASLADKDSE